MSQPAAYVRKMLTNEYLSWRRRKSSAVVPLSPETLGDYQAAGRDSSGQIDDRAAMMQQLAALPPKQRAVLALRYYCGLPDAAIAATLGCTEGTVRGYASRALATLRVTAAATFTPTSREG